MTKRRHLMTVPWSWLAACRECGVAHAWRPNDPNNPDLGGTWAAEGARPSGPNLPGGPGHLFQARLSGSVIAALQEEWELS